ncbi:type II toxin-antitoxin system VapC family toxin [Aliirhizobium terrae]|uniref:type II toxin-antitoxin system VapC family toxin n=1 Tax=Terrirhizobium terrae TaxID=2926709 RepID=UPI0025769FD1|nr:type II toxin-antitoxin system VapC family toxin [Rhizobium sp. CC-CFT758]WJH41844.1 type II toxin-antitoxin system VapC family toxin [Rhizobium sp. CC-CFT758]
MQGVGRLYLDTNVFIAAFEAEGVVAEKAAKLISEAKAKPQKSLVTSEMTLAELLVLPFRRSDLSLVEFYSGLLSSGGTVDLRPADRDIFLLSARLRSEISALKLPDAVHLATAMLSGCTHILTADKGIRPVGRLDYPIILRPDEPTLISLIESFAP